MSLPGLRISHVSFGVDDLEAAVALLRRKYGLGVWPFPGELGAHIPLAQLQYVELYAPPHPLWRPGWIAWSVSARNIDPWVAALGIDDTRPFGGDPKVTFTPWRGRLAGTTRARASGGVIPYFTEYDAQVDLHAIFADKHRVAAHESEPGAIAAVETDGGRITRVLLGGDEAGAMALELA